MRDAGLELLFSRFCEGCGLQNKVEIESRSLTEQHSVEISLLQCDSERLLDEIPSGLIENSDALQQLRICSVAKLNRESHVNFLVRGLNKLPPTYTMLDASRPWLCYWILHALDLLGAHEEIESHRPGVIRLLKSCQNESGGFGGGPGQISHLAPTYAAVNALCILGGEDSLSVINRTSLYSWLKSLKNKESGAFRVSQNGEEDIRGMYCALSISQLTLVLDDSLAKGCDEYIAKLQRFDGGLGGEPRAEAHGGYAFCAFASLKILGKLDAIDSELALRWLHLRQMRMEGGFSGRANKLVDSCYAFWIGACFPLLQFSEEEECSFSGHELSRYLLNYCQHKSGGMIDKPGRSPDFYHTCYALSGLSVAQRYAHTLRDIPSDDRLRKTNPVYNICEDRLAQAQLCFSKLVQR